MESGSVNAQCRYRAAGSILVDIEREGDDGHAVGAVFGRGGFGEVVGHHREVSGNLHVSSIAHERDVRHPAAGHTARDGRPADSSPSPAGVYPTGDGGERVSQADRSRLAGLTGDQAECLRRIITTLTPTASSIKPRPASAPTAAPVFATPSPLPSPSFLPVSAALTVTL